MRRLKVVFYAINGTGLGHITRLSNIARDMRWLLDEMGVPHQIEFLTTSDAPQVAGDFLVTKIPSKTTIKAQGLSTKEYAARARMMVGNMLSAMQPDLLVLDTTPQGSFNEFSFLKDFAKQTVFVDRHRDEAKAACAVHQAHLKLYDLIVVPETNDTANCHPCADIEAKCRRVGKITGFAAREALPRDEVRRLFQVQEDERLVYVSAGGGGDPTAEQDLRNLVTALSKLDKVKLLVGNGPLYQGWQCYAPNIINLASPNVRQYFGGLDFAVSAAGYNSYEELLAAKVPTLFFAQGKGLDRQDQRVAHGLGRDWNDSLTLTDGAGIQCDVNLFIQSGRLASVRRALRERPAPQGRFNAALEMLRVHTRRPHRLFDETLLLATATELTGVDYEALRPRPQLRVLPPDTLSA